MHDGQLLPAQLTYGQRRPKRFPNVNAVTSRPSCDKQRRLNPCTASGNDNYLPNFLLLIGSEPKSYGLVAQELDTGPVLRLITDALAQHLKEIIVADV